MPPLEPRPQTMALIRRLFAGLDPEKCYSPTMLVSLAEMENLFPIDESDPEDVRDHRARMRLRGQINRIMFQHPDLFPQPDGLIQALGQAPQQGFQGWRFQQAEPWAPASRDVAAPSTEEPGSDLTRDASGTPRKKSP